MGQSLAMYFFLDMKCRKSNRGVEQKVVLANLQYELYKY